MDDLHLAEESGLPRAVRASELSRLIFSRTFWRRGGWRLSWCPTRGKSHQGGGGRTLQPMFVLGFDLVWRVSYCTWKRRYLYKWYTYSHACATILFISFKVYIFCSINNDLTLHSASNSWKPFRKDCQWQQDGMPDKPLMNKECSSVASEDLGISNQRIHMQRRACCCEGIRFSSSIALDK